MKPKSVLAFDALVGHRGRRNDRSGDHGGVAASLGVIGVFAVEAAFQAALANAAEAVMRRSAGRAARNRSRSGHGGRSHHGSRSRNRGRSHNHAGAARAAGVCAVATSALATSAVAAGVQSATQLGAQLLANTTAEVVAGTARAVSRAAGRVASAANTTDRIGPGHITGASHRSHQHHSVHSISPLDNPTCGQNCPRYRPHGGAGHAQVVDWKPR